MSFVYCTKTIIIYDTENITAKSYPKNNTPCTFEQIDKSICVVFCAVISPKPAPVKLVAAQQCASKYTLPGDKQSPFKMVATSIHEPGQIMFQQSRSEVDKYLVIMKVKAKNCTFKVQCMNVNICVMLTRVSNGLKLQIGFILLIKFNLPR